MQQEDDIDREADKSTCCGMFSGLGVVDTALGPSIGGRLVEQLFKSGLVVSDKEIFSTFCMSFGVLQGSPSSLAVVIYLFR
jgi:Fe-S oxidoreductase